MIDYVNLFIDTEFTGLKQDTSLISLGIISENEKMFYAEFTDYNKKDIDNWLKENVLNNLLLTKQEKNSVYLELLPEFEGMITTVVGNKKYITKQFLNWTNIYFKNKKLKIWSDCLSYDWVLFNELFGGALNIPNNIYYIPFDICTLFELLHIDPDIPREEFIYINNNLKHNALFDAKIIRLCYIKLMYLYNNRIMYSHNKR